MNDRERTAADMLLAVSAYLQTSVGFAERSPIPGTFLQYTIRVATDYLLDVWDYMSGKDDLPEWYKKVCAAVQDQPDMIGADQEGQGE